MRSLLKWVVVIICQRQDSRGSEISLSPSKRDTWKSLLSMSRLELPPVCYWRNWCASGAWPGLCTVSQWTALKAALSMWLILSKPQENEMRALFAQRITVWPLSCSDSGHNLSSERTPLDFLWLPLETLFQWFAGCGLQWLLPDSIYCLTVAKITVMYRLSSTS